MRAARHIGRHGSTGAVVAVSLLLGSCGAQRAGSQDPVRVGYASGRSTATLWIADQQGYFTEQGVSIDWRQQHRPSTALPQLAAGNVDVLALTVTIPIFNLVARGERVRVVADRGHYAPVDCPSAAFVVRADRDPAALPARARWSANPGLVSDFLTDRARGLVGDAADGWQIVDVPSDSETQAVVGGGVDIVSLSEPQLSRALDEGLVRIWRTHAELYPFMQQYVLVFGPRLLDQDRELGARFLSAYLRAERELAAGKTEDNVAHMAAALDLDLAFARRMCWLPVHDDLSLSTESVADYQRWAVEKGLLDRVVGPGEYWDGWFAEQAVARWNPRRAAQR